MEKLTQLLDLGRIGNLLQGPYAESFLQLFGFVSWLAIVVTAVALFGKIPLVNRLLQMMKEDANRPFAETDLILEMLPNRGVRYVGYRLWMYGMVFVVFTAGVLTFYFGSLALLALIAKSLAVNKFTAFAVFLGLAGAMFFCMYSLQQEANKLACFLRQSRVQH